MDDISSITSDNFEGGRKVAHLLCDLGHERIGYIAGWEGASTQRDREAGFLAGLTSNNTTLFAREVGDFRTDLTETATFAMFDKPASERPDAVFVANDHMAFVVMDILRHDLGLRVPEDVSVVGYDDVPPAAWKSYDLTTVRQRANLMVEQTVETILDHIEDPSKMTPKKIQIDSPLIVRSSTRQERI
jgi:DNA-binding LacI/PurR family transcriptional regulator